MLCCCFCFVLFCSCSDARVVSLGGVARNKREMVVGLVTKKERRRRESCKLEVGEMMMDSLQVPLRTT